MGKRWQSSTCQSAINFGVFPLKKERAFVKSRESMKLGFLPGKV
jgi:hypothetical protein